MKRMASFLICIFLFALFLPGLNSSEREMFEQNQSVLGENNPSFSSSSNTSINSLGFISLEEVFFVDSDTLIYLQNGFINLFDIAEKSVIDSTNCSQGFTFSVYRDQVNCGDRIYSITNTSFTLERSGNFNPTYSYKDDQQLELGYYQQINNYRSIISVYSNGTVNNTYSPTNPALTQGSNGYISSFSRERQEATIVSPDTEEYVLSMATGELLVRSSQDCPSQSYHSSSDSINRIEESIVITHRTYIETRYCLQFGAYHTTAINDADFTDPIIDASYEPNVCDIYSQGQGVFLNRTLISNSMQKVDCLSTNVFILYDGIELFISGPDNDNDNFNDYVDDFVMEPSQNIDSDGDGYGDNYFGNFPDSCPNQFGLSNRDVYGCLDSDFDGFSESSDKFPSDFSQWNDSDDDGYGDNLTGNNGDVCPLVYGESTRDRLGCADQDYDGWSDENDIFPYDSSQWGDWDGDGYGDQLNGIEGDSCPSDPGNSTKDRYGCIDSDGDGWSDDGDDLPQNPTQWRDRDGDGYGDNQEENATMSDTFPADGTQWNDTDADGHGDNPFGTEGDWFPNDITRWQDSDRDGVADEDDAFPNEKSQTIDTDGDGYGDDVNGSNPDAFPNDAEEWSDTDGDGIGNNADAFPFDPSQQTDSDGDGFGDNERGSGADKFPSDSTQWADIDGDGYGDNAEGTNPDAFITDPTQWVDTDGDGYGDNPTGRLADAFIEDSTQWIDEDEDGFGDNQSGNNPDPFLFDFDNDGYNDSIDPLPKYASPGDLDNDGVLDEDDKFPEDFREWADNDGDEVGDNADTDDDNDGWSDADELRDGTDPFLSSEQPVDSFEIVIPGTAVGLGAWDLIGIFGGVPLFIWIGFGFITRNGRTAKYEEKLRTANTRDELEGVARQWEYSLMLRMLGPHQGIRLERLRAELDDVFERQNQTLSSLEQSEYNQTQLVQEEMNQNEKQVPEINLKPDIAAVGNPDEKGYEWITSEDGKNWYRAQGSKDDWVEFSN